MPLATSILASLVFIIVTKKYSAKMYETPREVLICLISCGLLCFGGQLTLPPEILILTCAMLSWWFLCALLSDHPNIAINKTLIFASSVYVAANLRGEWLLPIMVIAACLNAVVGLLQYWYVRVPLVPFTDYKWRTSWGIMGNSNVFGAYTVSNIFIAAHLGGWWWLAAALLTATYYASHCRAAIIGICAGVAYCYPMLLFVVLPPVIGYLLTQESNTLKERLNYWRVAVRVLPRSFFFGLGFDCFKTKVPYIQRDINTETDGEFLKPVNYCNPYPMRCHNDYLQHILDNGIVGLACYVSLAVYGLYHSTDPILSAALVSILVTGMFIHSFHFLTCNFMFWIVLMQIMPTEAVTVAPIWLALGVIPLVVKYVLIPAFWEGKYNQNAKNENCDLNSIKKVNTLIYSHSLQRNLQYGRLFDAFRDAINSMQYDGETRIWHTWTNLGAVMLRSNPVLLAMACYEYALSFYPDDKICLQNRDSLKEGLLNGRKDTAVNNKQDTVRQED